MFTLDEIINSKKISEIPRRLAREANDYSTKQARADARRRARIRKEIAASFKRIHDEIDAEKLRNLTNIPQEAWDAARQEDEANAA